MTAVPSETAVTTPSTTVATLSFELLHVTVLSVASSGSTVAFNVSVSPGMRTMLVLLRVTFVTGMNFLLTITWQVADLSPAVAVITTVPSVIAVTTPSTTVAIASSELLQVTVLSVASSGLTVAVRVSVSPSVISSLSLSREISVTGMYASLTVTAQVADLSPAVAVMVARPTATPVTTPSFTVAILSSELLQVTVGSVASSGMTVAVNVSLSPVTRARTSLSRVMPVTSTTFLTTVTSQVAVAPR